MSDQTKTQSWMPREEYEVLKKWKADQTPEQLRQHSYFFWNNFSMDGYEEWTKKAEENYGGKALIENRITGKMDDAAQFIQMMKDIKDKAIKE